MVEVKETRAELNGKFFDSEGLGAAAFVFV